MIPTGATGRFVSATDGSYLVQLPDGRQVQLRRAQVSVRRAYSATPC